MECLLDCSKRPFLASTKIIARFAVEAPVTIFLVYCICPGVSAIINLRKVSQNIYKQHQ